MTRIKAIAFTSRLEFERAVDEIARITVDLRKAEARRDARLQAVRDEYEPACTALADQLQGLALAAEKYAEGHREDLFVGKIKTAESPLAFFGFRLGQPTLKLLSKKCSWEGVLQSLKLAGLERFIRIRHEPDKDGMKQNLTAEQLAAVGTRIDQAETFFIEPKEKSAQEAQVA